MILLAGLALALSCLGCQPQPGPQPTVAHRASKPPKREVSPATKASVNPRAQTAKERLGSKL